VLVWSPVLVLRSSMHVISWMEKEVYMYNDNMHEAAFWHFGNGNTTAWMGSRGHRQGALMGVVMP
jgi:hypothetical protein